MTRFLHIMKPYINIMYSFYGAFISSQFLEFFLAS